MDNKHSLTVGVGKMWLRKQSSSPALLSKLPVAVPAMNDQPQGSCAYLEVA